MMNRLSSLATISLALLMTLPMACGDDGGGDGGGGDGDGGPNGTVDADLNVPPTAFRGSKMELLDPHAFAFGGSFDVNGIVNDTIAENVGTDGDDPPDGILDLNVSVLFRPLDPSSATSPIQLSFANCSAPVETTACTQTAMTTLIPASATNESSGTCLDALPDTTAPYDPPVVAVPAPCFTSDAVDVTVPLGTITLPLKQAQISATYSGDPATSLVTGLLRGYVTEADADVTLIPDDVALVGGDPLSSLLLDSDMDTGPNGETGWWFYISFEAELVDYTIE
jgi:hypothetical protein